MAKELQLGPQFCTRRGSSGIVMTDVRSIHSRENNATDKYVPAISAVNIATSISIIITAYVLQSSGFASRSQSHKIRLRARAGMEDTVRRWLVTFHRELRDYRLLFAWERRDVTLSSYFLQIRSNQPTIATALNPDLVQLFWETRMGCSDVRQSSHNQGVPAERRQHFESGEERVRYLLHLHGVVDGSSCGIWWQDSNECIGEVSEIEIYSTTSSIWRGI